MLPEPTMATRSLRARGSRRDRVAAAGARRVGSRDAREAVEPERLEQRRPLAGRDQLGQRLPGRRRQT